MMNVDARDIKKCGDVEPVRGTDDALVTKEEDLAPCEARRPNLIWNYLPERRLPESPTVLERVSVGDAVIEKIRESCTSHKLQPFLGLNRYFQAEAIQQVNIACTPEADTCGPSTRSRYSPQCEANRAKSRRVWR